MIVEGKEYIVEIATTSYTQEDFKDDIERRLQYSNNVVKRTKEASNQRNSLLEGPVSKSNTRTKLLTTNPKGEYILDKTFLHLAEEYSLSLRQDQYSTQKVVSRNQKTRSYRRFLQERIRYQHKQVQRKQEDIARLYKLFRQNIYENNILRVSLRRIQAKQRNINRLLYKERSRVVYITKELQELQCKLYFVA